MTDAYDDYNPYDERELEHDLNRDALRMMQNLRKNIETAAAPTLDLKALELEATDLLGTIKYRQICEQYKR